MEFAFIQLSAIDLEDRTFEIRKFSEAVRLRESLERFGILDPVWLLKKGARYGVVDGFKRLQWAAERGKAGTFCRIFPETLFVREIWAQRIEKKIFEPEIDLAEKAQIISVLLDLFPTGEIDRRFLCALNVSPRPELLRKWERLAAEGTEILRILASGETAERAALEVADWDRESRAEVLAILCSLRCSASIQVEIVERIDEIAIRAGKNRTEIMNSAEVRKILSQEDLNHRQKTQALRDLLTQLRYPGLTARERRFQEGVEALGLPATVRIVHPPAFEGSNWKMELSFSGPAGLRIVLDLARDVAASPRLDAVLGARKRRAETDGWEG